MSTKRRDEWSKMWLFPRLVEQAQKTRFFWIDDAWVTGMLGKQDRLISMKYRK